MLGLGTERGQSLRLSPEKQSVQGLLVAVRGEECEPKNAVWDEGATQQGQVCIHARLGPDGSIGSAEELDVVEGREAWVRRKEVRERGRDEN